jgi:Ca2+-binding RTX toxin-like protein
MVKGQAVADQVVAGTKGLVMGTGASGADIRWTTEAAVPKRLQLALQEGGDTVASSPVQAFLGKIFPNPMTVWGGEGNDTIVTGAGDDTVFGGDGDDKLSGGPGKDSLFGNDGNDTFLAEGLIAIPDPADAKKTIMKDDGDDTMDGGNGEDTVSYAARTAAVYVSLSPSGDASEAKLLLKFTNNATATQDIECDTSGDWARVGGAEKDDVCAGIEKIVGGSGDDVLIGSAADNTISGGAGNDLLIGRNGNDTLNGELGDDWFFEGSGDSTASNGSDIFSGGPGSDTVDYSGRENAGVVVTMDGVGANDGWLSDETSEGDNVKADIENLLGSRISDTLIGNSLPNQIWGLDGRDNIDGREGDDVFHDEKKDDIAGNERDVIRGGSGIDRMDYSGVDPIEGKSRTEGVVAIANQTIEVAATLTLVPWTSSTSFVAPAEALGKDSEDVLGTDIEEIVGTGSDDVIVGNALNNVLAGGGGVDILWGGDGDDILEAGRVLDTSAGATPGSYKDDGVADKLYCGNGLDVTIKGPEDTVREACEN